MGRVKPQQNIRSITAPKSLSPKDGNCFFADGCESSSRLSRSWSSSSSSITNCGSFPASSAISSTSSRFHSSSVSNTFDSPWTSNITGSTRCSIRRQFKTSFVAFLSAEEVPVFMIEDANAVTEADVVAVGNVWSEMRLKSRIQTT